MRRILLFLHKYAGLSLGLILSIVGITGSLLVFDHALDESLTPTLTTADDPLHRAPLAAVLAAAEDAVGDSHRADRIYLARQAGSPHVVRFSPPAGQPGPVEVSVAPADAQVLAVRTWGDYPASWVYKLHYTLLAGAPGKFVVGLLGVLLLFFCISGVVIWWPRTGRWRQALSIRRHRGAWLFNFDLHKTAGLYLLPVLATVAFSGAAIVFPGAVTAAVGTVLPLGDYPAPGVTPLTTTVSVDAAIAAGQAAFPGADLKRVQLPRTADAPYLVYFRTPAEPWSNLGASVAWVDPYTGRLLDTFDIASAPAGRKFLRWQFPLHNGDALGMPGRWLVFIAGWLPALLFATGCYLWWRKRSNVSAGRT